eukprot:TRINITY_DN86868_c0_g1_i1.p1 TRINITY_DN86868_c0_g1~~TRINITY_DN86868_c0_g1_i1.p1  ORF type:complete len:370 (-),score=95.45 TRINITY_DN86868_c0_g1_i1:14-1123(-)
MLRCWGAVMGSLCSSEFDVEKMDASLSVQVYDDSLSKMPSLNGKVIAITGCTTGTGFHLAEAAAMKGAARIFMLNRKSERATLAEERIRGFAAKVGQGTKVETVECDLQSFKSVRECAAKILAVEKSVDVLALNAGMNTTKDTRTPDGFDIQMQTNHLSHVLLLALLLPGLQEASKRGEARVVFHSSGARDMFPGDLRQEFFKKCPENSLGGEGSNMFTGLLGQEGPWQRYHQTKLTNAAFAMALHEQLKTSGKAIKALCAEPGAAATSMPGKVVEDGLVSAAFTSMTSSIFQSAKDGTAPIMMACFSPDAQSGDYFAPAEQMKGMPIKTISEGVPVIDGTEKLTTSQINKDSAWTWTLQALELQSLFS